MSKMLILSHDEVIELLPMGECIRLIREAFTALGNGKAYQPLRDVMRPPDLSGVLGMMPAYLAEPKPSLGMKTISVFPGNVAKGMDSHQGAVLLYSAETGELQAVMNASAITAIRTAAASGLATDLLARPEARVLALIGTGVEAGPHLEAMAAVRPIERCHVASRNFANAQKFAARYDLRYGFPLKAVESVHAATENADLIVTVTNAKEPVIVREMVAAGAHINAVGSCVPWAREIDGATMAAASLFTDRRESALNEAGDVMIALNEGAITEAKAITELGELLTGIHPGRTHDDELTLFESLGVGIEDVACAAWLYEQANEKGAGQWVEI
jgi:ornithine cyclodeaminase/alanine dehydrogenase-like protein (mu-crystallin family)